MSTSRKPRIPPMDGRPANPLPELVAFKWVVQPTLILTDDRQRRVGEFVPQARVFYEVEDLIDYLQSWTPDVHAQELANAASA